jgi:hypothetical protein
MVKNRLLYLIIAALVAIILLQRSCGGIFDSGEEQTTIKTDTVYKHIHDTIKKDVKVIYTEYVPIDKPEYTPGETLDTCKARFQDLLKEHLTKRVYADTLKLDSLGSIVIKDTVWINKLYGKRTYIKDYKIPYVTKTITTVEKEKPRRQLYVGGNVFGNTTALQAITPGLIYKDKKDRMYQANVGVNFNGSLTFGAGTYWKIKLNKK